MNTPKQNRNRNRKIKNKNKQNPVSMQSVINRMDNMQLEIQKARKTNIARSQKSNVARNSALVVGGRAFGPDIGFNRPNNVNMIMSRMGTTIEGQRWAMTALDPCGPVPDNMGIPDSSGAPVATPTYRGNYVISYDTTMFAVTPANPSPNYDIQIMNVPVPEIAFMYRIRDVASNTWSSTRVVRTDGFALPAAGQTAPPDGVTLKSFGYGKVRLSGAGYTYELDCSSNNNMGRVTSGQIECLGRVATGFAYVAGSSAAAGAGQSLQAMANAVEVAYRFPNDSAFLVNGCPNVYQCEAKEGAYVPIKFTGAVSAQQYKTTGEYSYSAASDTSNVVQFTPDTYMVHYYSNIPVSEGDGTAAPFTNDSSGAGQYGSTTTSPVATSTGWGLSKISPYITPPLDMMTSVTFFEGLASGYSGTGSTVSTNAAASVRVKSRLFIEAISTGAGAISPYVHRSPVLDQLAIDTVATVGQTTADAFPASFNSFGTIMNTIWTGIKRVARPLLGVVEKIPGAGLYAQAAKQGIQHIDNIKSLIQGQYQDVPLD